MLSKCASGYLGYYLLPNKMYYNSHSTAVTEATSYSKCSKCPLCKHNYGVCYATVHCSSAGIQYMFQPAAAHVPNLTTSPNSGYTLMHHAPDMIIRNLGQIC